METIKVYEYLTTKDWFGSLEKGCRLYYDHNKQGYVYHTEYDNVTKSFRYESREFTVSDYFISIDVANHNIAIDNLVPGPELGELEYKDDKRQLTKKQL